MSSLWTPDGEHRVQPEPSPADPTGGPSGGEPGGGGGDDLDDLSPEGREVLAARLDDLRNWLTATQGEVVIANHAYGLFELAAVHLSEQPPNSSRPARPWTLWEP